MDASSTITIQAATAYTNNDFLLDIFIKVCSTTKNYNTYIHTHPILIHTRNPISGVELKLQNGNSAGISLSLRVCCNFACLLEGKEY